MENLLPALPLDGHSGITLQMSEEKASQFVDWTRNQGSGNAGLVLAWAVYDEL
jgi:hypothetical protein